MKTKTIYETVDGFTFKTLVEAKKHCANRYDNEISRLTREIMKTRDGKHGDLIHWIDQNHERFDILKQIKDDQNVDGSDTIYNINAGCVGCRHDNCPGDQYPCNGCIRNSVDQYEAE